LTALTVPGVGVNTEDVQLRQGANELCESVEVVSFGKVSCRTFGATALSLSDELAIVVGTTDVSCVNDDPNNCRLIQDEASSPSVIDASITLGNQIVYNG